MATIKPIEARSIHEIQSGQVIVDLCSVVKELVENSLDAGATSLEVRFRNNGLVSIEVQDNGSGISPSNYENLALKHHTSKLTSYDDLSSLQTFGFRGEALSSLCAFSTLYVITALADEAPKGKKLEFQPSGKLKGVTVVAAQKGTTVVVEGLFEQLPVRKKELTKNIKREYGKVLGLLHAYACICTNVKFTVKSSMPKGKNVTVFATKANPTTRENIANVYGAKTLSALVPLDLQLDFQRTLSQKPEADSSDHQIIVKGHISRPVFGEGRQTPDRQMFYVNGRPCGLPQIAKAFNEVYKSFNVSQSPFIFADFQMDTNAYDVNVSPDKRTIMLHDSSGLVESLKSSLTELFDQQEQTVPQSHVQTSRLPIYKQLTIARESAVESIDSSTSDQLSAMKTPSDQDEEGNGRSLLHDFFRNEASTREEPKAAASEAVRSKTKKKLAKALEEEANTARGPDESQGETELDDVGQVSEDDRINEAKDVRVRDFNLRIAEQQRNAANQEPVSKPAIEQSSVQSCKASPANPRNSAIQNAFDRIRPSRPAAEVATITIADKTITTMIGSQPKTPDTRGEESAVTTNNTRPAVSVSTQAFTQRLRGFTAPGTTDAQINAETSREVRAGEMAEDAAANVDEISTESPSLIAAGVEDGEGASNESTSSYDAGSIKSSKDQADGEYIDEDEKKAQEDAVVAELIQAAEDRAASLNANNSRRAKSFFKSGLQKDSTTSLQVTLATSVGHVQELASVWHLTIQDSATLATMADTEDGSSLGENEEEHLALTVAKADFFNMHIVGQFNLGFILTVRARSVASQGNSQTRRCDELFIVDQHASDEKYNFEKLQEETVVGNQRLVRPKQLDLTAVEEEILIENSLALEKNGFVVSIDTSEDEPIGQKCKVVSLPLSKEVTFGLEDLEELLHLFAESPGLTQTSVVPRPSKVRKMFAMRACRSSIMIGKPLTETKMKLVVSHMGEIDKPWNCPHGRPTMRHLMTLNTLETWQEGNGTTAGEPGQGGRGNIWREYAQN
jgi:DNA mismatch repair protein PMS2